MDSNTSNDISFGDGSGSVVTLLSPSPQPQSPLTSQLQTATESEVDPPIIEALQTPKDRMFVLKLGDAMESLITERQTRSQFSLPTHVSSYHRLLVYRCAAYYKLLPETDPITKVLSVSVQEESRLPPTRLAQLVPPPSDNGAPNLKVQIMRRTPINLCSHTSNSVLSSLEHTTNGSSTDSSSVSDLVSTPDPSETDADIEAGAMATHSQTHLVLSRSQSSNSVPGTTRRSNGKQTSLAEREAAYKEARSRIFMGFQETDSADVSGAGIDPGNPMSSKKINGHRSRGNSTPASNSGSEDSLDLRRHQTQRHQHRSHHHHRTRENPTLTMEEYYYGQDEYGSEYDTAYEQQTLEQEPAVYEYGPGVDPSTGLFIPALYQSTQEQATAQDHAQSDKGIEGPGQPTAEDQNGTMWCPPPHLPPHDFTRPIQQSAPPSGGSTNLRAPYPQIYPYPYPYPYAAPPPPAPPQPQNSTSTATNTQRGAAPYGYYYPFPLPPPSHQPLPPEDHTHIHPQQQQHIAYVPLPVPVVWGPPPAPSQVPIQAQGQNQSQAHHLSNAPPLGEPQLGYPRADSQHPPSNTEWSAPPHQQQVGVSYLYPYGYYPVPAPAPAGGQPHALGQPPVPNTIPSSGLSRVLDSQGVNGNSSVIMQRQQTGPQNHHQAFQTPKDNAHPFVNDGASDIPRQFRQPPASRRGGRGGSGGSHSPAMGPRSGSTSGPGSGYTSASGSASGSRRGGNKGGALADDASVASSSSSSSHQTPASVSATSSSTHLSITHSQTHSPHPLPARPDWAVGLAPSRDRDRSQRQNRRDRDKDQENQGDLKEFPPLSNAGTGSDSGHGYGGHASGAWGRPPFEHHPASLQLHTGMNGSPFQHPTIAPAMAPNANNNMNIPNPYDYYNPAHTENTAYQLSQPPHPNLVYDPYLSQNTPPSLGHNRRLDEFDRRKEYERPPLRGKGELYNPKARSSSGQTTSNNNSGRNSPNLRDRTKGKDKEKDAERDREIRREDAIRSAILVNGMNGLQLGQRPSGGSGGGVDVAFEGNTHGTV